MSDCVEATARRWDVSGWMSAGGRVEITVKNDSSVLYSTAGNKGELMMLLVFIFLVVVGFRPLSTLKMF